MRLHDEAAGAWAEPAAVQVKRDGRLLDLSYWLRSPLGPRLRAVDQLGSHVQVKDPCLACVQEWLPRVTYNPR